MGRLDIFSNTGELAYGDGAVASELFANPAEQLIPLNRSQFYFHYRPGEILLCFFKGSRGVAGQFYGVYKPDFIERDELAAFKREVETVFESEGWSLSPSREGPHMLFEALTGAEPASLAIGEEDLHRELQSVSKSEAVKLGAPDYHSSLAVCKQLAEMFDRDLSISVCGSGVVEGMPDSDVVVIPRTSDEPGEPVGETKHRMDRRQLDRTIDEAREQLGNHEDAAFDDQQDGVRAQTTAAARLEEAGIGETGIVVDDPVQHRRRVDRVKWYATLAGFGIGLVAAVLVGLLIGQIPELIALLTQSVWLGVPGAIGGRFGIGSPGIQYESWLFLLVGVVSLLYTQVELRPVAALLGRIRTALPGRTSDGDQPERTASETAERFVETLETIATHDQIDHEKFGGFETVVEDIFEDSWIKIYSDETLVRKHPLSLAGQALAGLLTAIACVALFAGFISLVGPFWAGFVLFVFVAGVASLVPAAVRLAIAGLSLGGAAVTRARSRVGSGSSRSGSTGSRGGSGWIPSRIGSTTAGVSLPSVSKWISSYGTDSRGKVTYAVAFLVAPPVVATMFELAWRTEGVLTQIARRIAETIGWHPRFLVGAIFFAAAGFVIGSLIPVVLGGRRRFPAVGLSVGTLAVVLIAARSPLSLPTGWVVVPLLLSMILGGVGIGSLRLIARACGWDEVTRDRRTVQLVGLLVGGAVVVAFLERHLLYQPPIVYDFGEEQFVRANVAFEGLVLDQFTAVYLFATLALLWGFVAMSRSAPSLEVLVLGPPGGRQAGIPLGIYDLKRPTDDNRIQPVDGRTHVAYRGRADDESLISVNENTNKKYNILCGNEVVDPATWDHPQMGAEEKYYLDSLWVRVWPPDDDRPIEVWTPQYYETLLDEELTTRVRETKGGFGGGGTDLPERKVDADKDQAKTELAKAINSADVLVFTFPVDGAEASTDQKRAAQPEPDPHWYVDVYRKLLGGEGPAPPYEGPAFGVATRFRSAGSQQPTGTTHSDGGDWKEMRRQETIRLSKENPALTDLIEDLDNRNGHLHVVSFRSDGDQIARGGVEQLYEELRKV